MGISELFCILIKCIAIVRTDQYNEREKADNMFYKRIILNRGLPFEVKLPTAKPVNAAGQLDRLEERDHTVM